MTNHNKVQNVPGDEEIIAWASEEQFFLFCDQDELLDIVRGTIAKYGAPLGPLTVSLSPDPRGVHVAVHQGSECVHGEAMALPGAVGRHIRHPSNPNQTASERMIREMEWENRTGLNQADVLSNLAASPTPPAGEGQEPVGWQPIERAPKDGSSVLLRGKGSRRIADGCWLQAANNGTGAWVWPYVHSNPTQWMPLPPTPSDRPESLLRPAIVSIADERKLPDLVVTRNGVPVADQEAGVREFLAACTPDAERPAASVEPVAFVSGSIQRVTNGPGDYHNVGHFILIDDSMHATIAPGTKLYLHPAPQAAQVVECNCPSGNKPAELHAPNCPVRQSGATLFDPYDGGTFVAAKPAQDEKTKNPLGINDRIWLIDNGECIDWAAYPNPSGSDEPPLSVEYTRAALSTPPMDAWIEEACARIKAADDAAADNDYMLDSDDCIKVLRGEWQPDAAIAAMGKEGEQS